MSDETKKEAEKKSNEDAAVKPDPETLNTTDPQEHMEGPISSLVHKVEKAMEGNDEKDKKDDEQ